MRLLFITLLATFAMRTCVHGAVIYSQVTINDPSSSFASSNIVNHQKIADNFFISGSGPYTIRSLHVIGGYDTFSQPLEPLPNDNFQIVFLEDDAVSPGSPESGGDFSVSSGVIRTPTDGKPLNGVGRPIGFVVDLGEGITLERGNVYWISVSNNPLPGSGWAWARAGGVLDSQVASTTDDVLSGPWNVVASNAMWFELYDHNIPEPTSSLLILLGITTTLIARPRNLPS